MRYVIVLALIVQYVIISCSCYGLLLLQGANFRDLPGVIVDEDNKVKFDPSVERPKLKSGKFLVQMKFIPTFVVFSVPIFCSFILTWLVFLLQVPDYAVSFVNGKSKK